MPFIFKIPYISPPSSWLESQMVTASDPAGSDNFGRSVSVDGTTAVIGARAANGGAGAAYIFEYNGSVWNQVQKITASDGAAGDNFGISVSINGNAIVVGAYFADPGGNSNQGAAYVFEKGGTWPVTETAKITASDGAADDSFGVSVSISGNAIVVGAYGSDPGGLSAAGAVYIFEKGGTWPATETAKITASDGAASDLFGTDVSISGNVIVVGARYTDIGGNSNQGAGYVFEKGASWPATETAKITASDGAVSDSFGVSVSISGNAIVVGAANADQGGNTDQGAAYVFEKSGTWPATETAKITASDGATNDWFGEDVSISGNAIVVGAYGANPNSNGNAGTTYIFEKDTSWPATETSFISASDGVVGDNMGFSVSVSGNFALSGAHNADPSGVSNAGKAYFLNKQ